VDSGDTDSRRRSVGPTILCYASKWPSIFYYRTFLSAPSIFLRRIFQHSLEYMDTDSPSEGLPSSKIAKNQTKSAKNRSEVDKKRTKSEAKCRVLGLSSYLEAR
jgi:hypothetical protein